MLEFLRNSGRLTDRKARLFAVACCRTVWHVTEPAHRQGLAVVERFVDGQATEEEVSQEENLAWWIADGLNYESEDIWDIGWAAHDAIEGNSASAAKLVALAIGKHKAHPVQVNLLHDLFGPLPFRPLPLDRASLTAAVQALAEVAYAERLLPSGTLDPQRLGVLADAAEEVALPREVVEHLRSPGPHWRGCWAVDVLSGKE